MAQAWIDDLQDHTEYLLQHAKVLNLESQSILLQKNVPPYL
jgi:hypothetical protein